MKETKVVVTGLVDGVEVQLSISDVEGMTQEQAEEINSIRAEHDHIEKLHDDYDRHHRDKLVEGIRYAIQRGQAEDKTDPLDKVADPRADIFSILYPQKEEDSKIVKAVKQVIKELPESQSTAARAYFPQKSSVPSAGTGTALRYGTRRTNTAG